MVARDSVAARTSGELEQERAGSPVAELNILILRSLRGRDTDPHRRGYVSEVSEVDPHDTSSICLTDGRGEQDSLQSRGKLKEETSQ